MQNLPEFANQGGGSVERLESGTQAIIPDYSFDCYGNVTQWGAFVERAGGIERYTLDFQVWRRKSGGGQGTTGEYDFVGSNRFSQIDPGLGGEILETVSVERQIEVRPGDVIGFYVLSQRNDDGVELQHDNNPPGGRVVTAWFTTSAASTIPTSIRVRTSNTRSGDLHTSTTAAPIITAMVALSPSLIPAPSPTPFPSHTPSLSPTLYPSSTPPSSVPSPSFPSSLPENVLASSSTVLPLPFMITQTGTSQTTQTSLTQAPVQLSTSPIAQTSLFLPPPPATTSSPVGSGLPVGAIAAIVIVVLIVVVLGVLVFVLALALRRRRSKKPPDNPELLGN